MRHRKRAKKLGRNATHRKAMQKNMALALFEHERITTTSEKAKFVRPFIERLITLARTKTDHNQRLVFDRIQGSQRFTPYITTGRKREGVRPSREKREVTERWDRRIIKKLFDEIGPLFIDRPGGYTRIIRKPGNRLGDNASQVIFELVRKTTDDADEAAPATPAAEAPAAEETASEAPETTEAAPAEEASSEAAETASTEEKSEEKAEDDRTS